MADEKQEDKDKKKKEENPEEAGPTGKVNNVPPGGNIFDDSFFEDLGSIDDGLGNPNFGKLGEDTAESLDDALKDLSLNLNSETKKAAPPTPKSKIKTKNTTTESLPASKLPTGNSKVKEKKMADKSNNPLDLPDDDPNAESINEIWKSMSSTDPSEFKLMALRLEPQTVKGVKISGYLETFHLPTTIPDIIEKVGEKYGGGKYQIRIVNGKGQYVKSKQFEISGPPKLQTEESSTETIKVNGGDTSSITVKGPAALNNDEDDGDIDDEEDWPDNDLYSRPRPSFGSPYSSGYNSPYGSQFGSPYAQSPGFSGGGGYSPRGSLSRDEVSKDDLEKFSRDVEDRVTNKIESKFDKMADMMQNMMLMQNNKKESFLNADVVKALAPVVVTWLDGKSHQNNSNVNQFSEMNKQMVGLMEGMQNLVRLGDKTKEDFSEKERRAREEFAERERKERENARREALEYQRQMEERHQRMMMQMKESLESKHQVAIQSSSTAQLQLEKMRQEFREKEEAARRDAREREEKLRLEAQRRDEESRRKEMEFWQKQRAEEMKWREEMRLKEEESRQRELQWREEIRSREVERERELKLRELEMMKTIQEMNNQKSTMQHKLLEQVYSNNNNNRESQLQMEMAIARMTNDNEARMMQANAEMQLEKIRHATQMQMTKMKADMQALESKKDEDPIDSAMQQYLKRKLEIDMIKELNMDVAEDDIPSGGIMGIAKKLLSDGGGSMLMNLLLGGGGGNPMGGMMSGAPPQPTAPAGRVVNPVPTPRPVAPTPTPKPPETSIHDLDDYDEDEDDIQDEENENEVVEVESEDLDTDDENDEDFENEDDDMEVPAPDIDMLREIPRVAQFFGYLQQAIVSNEVTPEQAAVEAKNQLSPEIVQFLMQISDSRLVIAQLYPLLVKLGGEESASFFTTDEVYTYMDKMLAAMAGKTVEDDPEPEAVEPEPEPKPTPPKPKAKTPPKPKAKSETPKPKRSRKTKAKEEDKEDASKEEEAPKKKTRRGRKKKEPAKDEVSKS